GFHGSRAEVSVREVRGDHGDAFLPDAADLRGTARDADGGYRLQRNRSFGGRVDDQPAHVLDAGIPGVDAFHQHVDLLVTPGVARGEFAADVRYDAIRDVPDGKPERSGAFLVEDDLDFRIAEFDRGLDVGEAIRSGKRCDDV